MTLPQQEPDLDNPEECLLRIARILDYERIWVWQGRWFMERPAKDGRIDVTLIEDEIKRRLKSTMGTVIMQEIADEANGPWKFWSVSPRS